MRGHNALTARQAYHWCLDHEAAAAEFARVLKPEGVLALTWNGEDRDAAEWVRQVRERMEHGDSGYLKWGTGAWRQIFETPSYTKYFLQPEEQIFRYGIPGTMEAVVSRALTSSRVSTLTDTEKATFVKDAEAIIQRGEGKVWIEEDKGIFVFPQRIYIVISTRKM